MKKLLAALAVLALFVGLFNMIGTAGAADDNSMSFQIGYEIRRGPNDSEVRIGAADVPKNLQGRTCRVTLQSENNSSVHPGNDVIVRSGSDSVEFLNVETSRDAQTFEGASPLTLGTEVVADLRFGPHRVTSSGFLVTIVCPPPPTTTTVPPTTTTEQPVTTTTEPPVVTTTVKPPVTTVPPVTAPPVSVPPSEIHTSSVAIALIESEPAVPVVAEPDFTG